MVRPNQSNFLPPRTSSRDRRLLPHQHTRTLSTMRLHRLLPVKSCASGTRRCAPWRPVRAFRARLTLLVPTKVAAVRLVPAAAVRTARTVFPRETVYAARATRAISRATSSTRNGVSAFRLACRMRKNRSAGGTARPVSYAWRVCRGKPVRSPNSSRVNPSPVRTRRISSARALTGVKVTGWRQRVKQEFFADVSGRAAPLVHSRFRARTIQSLVDHTQKL